MGALKEKYRRRLRDAVVTATIICGLLSLICLYELWNDGASLVRIFVTIVVISALTFALALIGPLLSYWMAWDHDRQ